MTAFVLVTKWLHSRPNSGELRTPKLKSHLLRTQSLKVLPLKPGVGPYIAIHTMLTEGFRPFRSIHLHFSKTSRVFSVLALAGTGSYVAPQNKVVTLLDADVSVECPRNIDMLQNMCYCFLFSMFAFRNCGWSLSLWFEKKETCDIIT